MILRPPSRQHAASVFILLLLVTFAAYFLALRNGFIWDDETYVTRNACLRSGEGLRSIWFQLGAIPQYYPLTHTSYWLEYRLWGLSPFGYHFINILLHGCNATLLYFLLRRLRVPGALGAACLFALHPVHVESVVWVTERKNVLSGLFYLLSALAYWRFHDDGSTRWRWYLFAFAAFAAALLSKTVAATLPAALLLLHWWRGERISRQLVLRLAPFFLLAFALGMMTVLVESGHVSGTGGDAWNISFAGRCLIAGRAVWFYAGKLLFPSPLIFNYPRWVIDTGAAWQYLYPLAGIAVTALLWRMRMAWGRGPLTALLFFIITLAPALGFINLYPMRFSFVADHFQYLASIGLLTLAAASVAVLFRKLPPRKKRIGLIIVTLLLLNYGLTTYNYCPAFYDLTTLWEDTISKNPGSWLACYNLGKLLHDAGRLAEAARYYRAALVANPGHAKAHNNLGIILTGQGRLAEARGQFLAALAIAPSDALARRNLGLVYERMGDIAAAIEQYRTAIAIAPGLINARFNLAENLFAQGHRDEAAAQLTTILQLDPGNPVAARLLKRMAATP